MGTNLSELLNRVHHSDCVAFMKTLPDNCIDSIVTDPPYELGFMGKSWDNTGIANSKEMRGECLRILKPGGHLLSFSGTRTYHRMACAIEDAGFEVRDMIEWVYGSGFPKSLNIGKSIDKLQGNEREETDYIAPDGKKRWGGNSFSVGEPPDGRGINKHTKGTSEWEGWGTALKPAHEPICMARKPIEGTVAENCLKWGTGGINIDESRVETTEDLSINGNRNNVKSHWGNSDGENKVESSPLGRFPANLIHDNSEEVRECFPETKTGAMNGTYKNTMMKGEPGVRDGKEIHLHQEASSGNASRFFKSILYYPKSSKAERNKGCDGLEEKLSSTLARQITKKGIKQEFGGFGAKPMTNNHPTVKPIALMEYLIKMVTKEGGIVFDPFAGSGTTLVAAKKNGYQYLGTELTDEYIPIIEARLNATEEEQEEVIDRGWFG